MIGQFYGPYSTARTGDEIWEFSGCDKFCLSRCLPKKILKVTSICRRTRILRNKSEEIKFLQSSIFNQNFYVAYAEHHEHHWNLTWNSAERWRRRGLNEKDLKFFVESRPATVLDDFFGKMWRPRIILKTAWWSLVRDISSIISHFPIRVNHLSNWEYFISFQAWMPFLSLWISNRMLYPFPFVCKMVTREKWFGTIQYMNWFSSVLHQTLLRTAQQSA